MNHQKIKKYCSLCFFFIGLNIFSQNYSGKIAPIKQDGLYKIALTPEIRSASNENFSFLRIKDAQNNDVPYVLISDSNRQFSTYSPVNFLSKKRVKDTVTSVLIKNESGNTQEHITLQIANTKVTKTYSVYGSNDAKKWFGLVANQRLLNISTTNATSVKKTIRFPLNNYKFLRIDFDDKKSLPINVIGAGVYKNEFFLQQPIKIEFFNYNITQLKDKKITQITFKAKKPHNVYAISFTINTDFFLREASLIVSKTRKVKKRMETYNKVISSFQLNSKNNNTFVFNNLNEKEFTINIDNKDNPPLQIELIQLLQKPVYLIADLKQNKPYKLVIDSTLVTPSYDLKNFVSNTTNNVKETSVLHFSKHSNKSNVPKSNLFWQSTFFMWGCIILGCVIVVYFALNLLKDIKP